MQSIREHSEVIPSTYALQTVLKTMYFCYGRLIILLQCPAAGVSPQRSRWVKNSRVRCGKAELLLRGILRVHLKKGIGLTALAGLRPAFLQPSALGRPSAGLRPAGGKSPINSGSPVV